MIKVLYANGCSMAEGCELGNEQWNITKPDQIMTNRDALHITSEHRRHIIENCWPYLLGKKLGITDIVNTSQCGSSNARIVRDTLIQVSKLLKTYKPEEIFVVIGWSRLSRIELYEHGYYYQTSAENTRFLRNQQYKEFVKTHEMLANSESKYVLGKHFTEIIALRSFLDAKGIKSVFTYGTVEYIPNMLRAFELRNACLSEEVLTLFNSKILDGYWVMNETRNGMLNENSTLEQYMNYVYENSFQHFQIMNKFKAGLGNHPLEEAHEAWAEYVKKRILEKGILQVPEAHIS